MRSNTVAADARSQIFSSRHYAIAGRLAAVMTAVLVATIPAAAESVFTVARYPVQAKDKNAVEAKKKAMEEGQKSAFRSLLKRIVPVTAYKQIARLHDVDPGMLVSGVSVRSERNSATTYLASLDFSFQPNAVRSALQSQGVPFIETQAEQLTVIPVLRDPKSGKSQNDSGYWRSAWAGQDLENSVTPIRIGQFKSEIRDDTVNMLINGDSNGMRILADEYQTPRVLLAIAQPDLASQQLSVTLVGQDAVGPINLERIYRISDNDAAYAAELAAVVALGVLEGRWKSVKYDIGGQSGMGFQAGGRPVWATTNTGTGQRVQLTAEFDTLNQWNDIRSKLLNTPGVEALEIASVTARQATLSLSYPGGSESLMSVLDGRGLVVTPSYGGLMIQSPY